MLVWVSKSNEGSGSGTTPMAWTAAFALLCLASIWCSGGLDSPPPPPPPPPTHTQITKNRQNLPRKAGNSGTSRTLCAIKSTICCYVHFSWWLGCRTGNSPASDSNRYPWETVVNNGTSSCASSFRTPRNTSFVHDGAFARSGYPLK